MPNLSLKHFIDDFLEALPNPCRVSSLIRKHPPLSREPCTGSRNPQPYPLHPDSKSSTLQGSLTGKNPPPRRTLNYPYA